MAKVKVLMNEAVNRRRQKKKKEVVKKIRKVKREQPDISDERLSEIQQELIQELNDKYRIKKGYDYLSDMELIILDGVLKNRNKLEMARELKLSLSGLYYKISTPVFQKAFQTEMKDKFDIMKKARKAMYVKIAEKSLNILLSHLEKVEQEQNKHGYSMEKMKDVIAIAEKVMSMMQDEEGGKTTNINLESNNLNTNIVADAGTNQAYNLADKEFRKHLGEALIKSHTDSPIL